MGLPKDVTLTVVPGDAFEYIVDYVDDETPPAPIDITGETVTMRFYDLNGQILTLVLTSGSGLTITPQDGRIQINLTGAQTDTLDGLKDRRYSLRLDTSETTIMFGRVDVFIPV